MRADHTNPSSRADLDAARTDTTAPEPTAGASHLGLPWSSPPGRRRRPIPTFGSTPAGQLVAELLELAEIEVNGPSPTDIQVHDDRFYRRVLRDRQLGLGESYQLGWWSSERLDDTLARMLRADLTAKVGSRLRASPRLLAVAVKAALLNRQSVGRAAVNASAHYDIGNDLYSRMLDRRMIYSCAYWDGTDDLDRAQEAKLELICTKLGLSPGMRLLDIGCGWGGLAQFAAERYGVTVTGISLAANQVEVAAERCADLPVDIRLQDFRDVEGEFDRIVSVGMLEHVGPKNYRALFDATDRLLTDDGVVLHHTIGSNDARNHTDPWFDRYVFPGGVIPAMEHLGRAAGPLWVLEDLHNFGPYYDRTLLAWHANVSAAWSDLPAYDEEFRRTWDYYLLGSAAAFRTRNLQLWQLVYRRAGRPSEVYPAVR